ncbi:hypothetical protein QJS66_02610 [Kocuria rhizophila]|nr:hypothetical protein QJS66_02610 [Kocuria rhizophila]
MRCKWRTRRVPLMWGMVGVSRVHRAQAHRPGVARSWTRGRAVRPSLRRGRPEDSPRRGELAGVRDGVIDAADRGEPAWRRWGLRPAESDRAGASMPGGRACRRGWTPRSAVDLLGTSTWGAGQGVHGWPGGSAAGRQATRCDLQDLMTTTANRLAFSV